MHLGWKHDNPALQRGIELIGASGTIPFNCATLTDFVSDWFPQRVRLPVALVSSFSFTAQAPQFPVLSCVATTPDPSA